MSIELTHLSASEYETIVSGKMTPAIAADYLRHGKVVTRCFAKTLKQMYPNDDLSVRLTDFFLAYDADANPQSVSRKIRNWVSGKNQPANREDIFKTAFALDLGEQQLNSLLCLSTGYCIQYRDCREVILAWFLRSGHAYKEALDFLSKLPQADGCNLARSKRTAGLTHEIQTQFQLVQTTEDLKNCYLNNLDKFGAMHLRAYYYFDKYLNLLIHPAPPWASAADEPDYSLETVMKIYLSLKVPSGRNRTGYTVVQKLLKQNWPNSTSIKNIRSHKEDVPRKLLLLLYVVTENETSNADSYNDLDEEFTTLEDRVEYHWWTLNAILEDCGMAPLDLHNAMDWLILYAISAGVEEPMSERLEQVMGHMFETAP